jgi:non-heme chloroperoxidase
MFDHQAQRKTFTTSDGAEISYLEAGTGQPFIMIPGWSQTAEQWGAQIKHFSKTHRVLALDMRGHGDSNGVTHGFRITRLSKDVRDLIMALDLHDTVLMGHSMGCSVIWGYFDLWGSDRVAKLVLCDQSPFLSDNPLLSDQEKIDSGVLFTDTATWETCAGLAGPDGEAVTRGFVGGMFTPGVDAGMLEEAIQLNLKFDRKHSGDMIVNHVFNDWRDVIERIEVPVLVIGGEISLVPVPSQRWVAKATGGEVEIFGADEGGAHFMFMENPSKFNERVGAFLNRQ